jgi:hypothetical protein
MAYIEMVEVEDATGLLAENYRLVAERYSHGLGFPMPTPELYRVSSQVPAYTHALSESQRCVTGDGEHYCESDGIVPRLFAGFCVATLSACFH